MAEFRVDQKESKKLKSELGVRGSVVAVGLPQELVEVLGIRATSVFARDSWEKWIAKVPKADCVLLWIEERRDDDQIFLERLARHLPSKSVLWSFHAMSILLSDRLTGDAVQTLLTAGDLEDRGCKNVGVGYYARRFVRAKGSKAEAVVKKKTTTRKVVTQSSKDVQRRNTIRTQKVKEALERSKNLQSSESMRRAFDDVDEPVGSEKATPLPQRRAKKEPVSKKAVKKTGKKATKKTVKKSAAATKSRSKKAPVKKVSSKKTVTKKKAGAKKKASRPARKKSPRKR